MNYKVLIIEDDKDLGRLLKGCLFKKQFYTDLTVTGAQGLSCLHTDNSYHLIVLDIMLPDIEGFDVLAQIRQSSTIPVIMLTARNEERDKVKGLTMGADDYLTKPFSINEFLARTEALIRRYAIFDKDTAPVVLESGKLRLDPATRQVYVNGFPVLLTSKEFDLLFFLASSPGQVFTKRQIYRQVWEEDYAYDDANIMSFISRLRKKLGVPEYIQTVRGVGYRFIQEESR